MRRGAARDQKTASHQQAEQVMHEKVGDLFGITDADLEQMRNCICPKRGCPVHPDSPVADIVEKSSNPPKVRRR